MLGSFTVQPSFVIAGGLTLLTLLVIQMLIGYHKIHFKGKRHIQIHRAVAWTMLVVALGHGFLALVLFGVIR